MALLAGRSGAGAIDGSWGHREEEKGGRGWQEEEEAREKEDIKRKKKRGERDRGMHKK